MQAPDDDGAGGVAGGAGAPDSQGGPKGPGGCGSTRAEGAAAGGAPPVEGSLLASEQAGEASALGRAPERQLLEFAYTVPFLSHMDAEVARWYLAPLAEPYRGAVHWDVTVTGSDLAIQLAAEDCDILEICTASLLSQLSIVVQILQHFVIPIFAKPHPA